MLRRETSHTFHGNNVKSLKTLPFLDGGKTQRGPRLGMSHGKDRASSRPWALPTDRDLVTKPNPLDLILTPVPSFHTMLDPDLSKP